MNSLVSVVIPTYNRARDLERALKSVLAQSYSHWEALIIDNHSDDNTDNLVKGFNDPRIKLFKIHNNGVIAASRNLGIKKAKGEYIAFLDSDDWWFPEKLEESLKYLEQGLDVVYHPLYLVTKPDQRLFWKKGYTRNLKPPVFDDLLINGNALNNSSVVIRRKLLNEINGFSEDRSLVSVEDYDGWLRAARITEKFKKIPQTLGYYWLGGGNVTNPERTLKTLDALECQYRGVVSGSGVYWHYVRGRALYRLGHYGMAKNSLARIRWRLAPLLIYLKSRWMLSLINYHQKFNP